jgi:hypothetical protein
MVERGRGQVSSIPMGISWAAMRTGVPVSKDRVVLGYS